MAEPAPLVFHCPSCHNQYRWKPQLAGRKVKCRCEATFEVPTEADAPIDPEPTPAPVANAPADNAYELNLDENSPASAAAAGSEADRAARARCPSCGSKMNPGAVICLNCGFNIQQGKPVRTQIIKAPAPAATDPAADAPDSPADPLDQRARAQAEMAADAEKQHRFEDYFLPLILMGVGALLLVIANLGHVLVPYEDLDTTMRLIAGAGLLLKAGIRFVIQVPVLFLGIFVVARLFGTSFGSIGSTVLKLMAVALCTGAANDTAILLFYFASGGLWGMGIETMIAMGVSLLTFMALCMKLLELEVMESIVLYMLLIVGPWVILFFGAIIVGSFLAA